MFINRYVRKPWYYSIGFLHLPFPMFAKVTSLTRREGKWKKWRQRLERRGRRGTRKRKGASVNLSAFLHGHSSELVASHLTAHPSGHCPWGPRVSSRRAAHSYFLKLLPQSPACLRLGSIQISPGFSSYTFSMPGPGLFFCHYLLFVLYRLSHTQSLPSINYLMCKLSCLYL